jgi:hypothetical protein
MAQETSLFMYNKPRRADLSLRTGHSIDHTNHSKEPVRLVHAGGSLLPCIVTKEGLPRPFKVWITPGSDVTILFSINPGEADNGAYKNETDFQFAIHSTYAVVTEEAFARHRETGRYIIDDNSKLPPGRYQYIGNQTRPPRHFQDQRHQKMPNPNRTWVSPRNPLALRGRGGIIRS